VGTLGTIDQHEFAIRFCGSVWVEISRVRKKSGCGGNPSNTLVVGDVVLCFSLMESSTGIQKLKALLSERSSTATQQRRSSAE